MNRELLQGIEPRILTVVLGGLTALLLVILVLYGIRPGYAEFIKNRDSLELLKTQMDDSGQLQQRINDQRRNIIALKRELNGESSGLAVNELESYLIGRLQKLAWQSGLQLMGVRPGKARRVLEFDEIAFEVSVSGRYQQLYQWITSLSDSLGFVMVTRYHIQPAHGASDDDELNMNTTLVFYRVSL